MSSQQDERIKKQQQDLASAAKAKADFDAAQVSGQGISKAELSARQDAARKSGLAASGFSEDLTKQSTSQFQQQQQSQQTQKLLAQQSAQQRIQENIQQSVGGFHDTQGARFAQQQALREQEALQKKQQEDEFGKLISSEEKTLPSGETVIIETFEKEVVIPDPFAAQKKEFNKQQREFEKQQIESIVGQAKSVGATEILISTKEGKPIKTVSLERAPLELTRLGRSSEGGVTISFTPPKDPKAKELAKEDRAKTVAFIKEAKEAGAHGIVATNVKTGEKTFIPIGSARHEIIKESKKGEVELSYSPPKERVNFSRDQLSTLVEEGIIKEETLTPQQRGLILAEKAARPIGDFFFPAAEAITGEKTRYTPSTFAKAIEATVVSSKAALGFAEKGVPLEEQTFAATFGKLGQEVSKDPIGTLVQIPAEIGVTLIGGRAVTAGKEVLQSTGTLLLRKSAQRAVEKELTIALTGKPPRKVVTTTFEEPITQKTQQVGTQKIATEVIIPVTRKTERPAIVAEQVKGRSDLFKIEGRNIPDDQIVFAQKTESGLEIIRASPTRDIPLTAAPKQVVVQGQIGFDVAEQVARQKETGLTQVGRDLFVSAEQPSPELLRLVGTSLREPVEFTRFTIGQVKQAPKEFGRFLFGKDSRAVFEASLAAREKPLKISPTEEFLRTETASFGTVGSRIGAGKPDIIRGTGEFGNISSIVKKEIPSLGRTNVKNINRRITSEQQKLDKLDRKDPKYLEKREIIENRINQLERAKQEIAQSPRTVEVARLTKEPKEFVKAGATERTRTLENYLKGIIGKDVEVFTPFREKTVRIFDFGRLVGKSKAFQFLTVKKKQATDVFVTDVLRSLRFVDPFSKSSIVRGSKGKGFGEFKTAPIDSKEVAGGAGRAKSILEDPKQATKLAKELIPKQAKPRQDAFGEIGTPAAQRPIEVLESQEPSVLEPQSISRNRPTILGLVPAKTQKIQDLGVISSVRVSPTRDILSTDSILNVKQDIGSQLKLSQDLFLKGISDLATIAGPKSSVVTSTRQTSRSKTTPITTSIIIPQILTTETQKTGLKTTQLKSLSLFLPFEGGKPIRTKPTTFIPFIGGFGGGGGRLGGGSEFFKFTDVFKLSVKNPIVPSLSIGADTRITGRSKIKSFKFLDNPWF